MEDTSGMGDLDGESPPTFKHGLKTMLKSTAQSNVDAIDEMRWRSIAILQALGQRGPWSTSQPSGVRHSDISQCCESMEIVVVDERGEGPEGFVEEKKKNPRGNVHKA